MSIYTDNGYANRKEYLNELREEYGEIVNILTSVLPASEDFDGLITSLEDAMDSGEYDDLMWHSRNWHTGGFQDPQSLIYYIRTQPTDHDYLSSNWFRHQRTWFL